MKFEIEDWVPGDRVIEWGTETLRRQQHLAIGPAETAEMRAARHVAAGDRPRANATCGQCQRRFMARRSTAKHCSNRCKQRAKRRRNTTR